MVKRLTLIQGHPDYRETHFGHALMKAYIQGAEEAGHKVRVISIAQLDFPLLRTKEDYESGIVPDQIRQAQKDIEDAEHLVIFYPLWMGTMPALLKAFIEQVFRPGFAYAEKEEGKGWNRLLKGKSARIVVTMGMPALIYRWYFGAYSLRSLERNILGMCGIGPIRESLVGMVDGGNARRDKWLDKMYALGRKAG